MTHPLSLYSLSLLSLSLSLIITHTLRRRGGLQPFSPKLRSQAQPRQPRQLRQAAAEEGPSVIIRVWRGAKSDVYFKFSKLLQFIIRRCTVFHNAPLGS